MTRPARRAPAAVPVPSAVAVGIAIAIAIAMALGLGPVGEGVARAEDALVREGQRLFEAGDVARACRTFEEAEARQPAVTTLLNVAYCHEFEGKTASALREYTEAAAAAARAGITSKETFAREHAVAIRAKLAYLELALPAATDLHVTIDGRAVDVDHAARRARVAVDPGPHYAAVTADDGRAWSGTPTIPPQFVGALQITVALSDPPRAPSAAGAPAAAPENAPARGGAAPRASFSPDAPDPGKSRRTVGYVVGGAGLAALGASAVFGLEALGRRSDATSMCNGKACSQAGLDALDGAKGMALASDVALGVGAAALATGIVLVVTAPSAEPPAAAAAAGSGPAGSGPAPERRRAAAARLVVGAAPLAGGAGVRVSGVW